VPEHCITFPPLKGKPVKERYTVLEPIVPPRD
jgi:hypothetical protein